MIAPHRWVRRGPAAPDFPLFCREVQTLLHAGMTVVEVWPGAGWYTQIIAPYLRETGGKLYAASYPVALDEQSASATAVTAYREL
ncbi:MAG: hypothetical protein V4609_05345, partial [Pseudomonadota bacterium]